MEQLKEFRTSFLMYDIFGYFLPGFFFTCLIVIDYDMSRIIEFYVDHNNSLSALPQKNIQYKLDYLFRFLTWNTENDFKFTTLAIYIFFCYLIGHILAALSSFLIEAQFNARLLGFPSTNLLSTNERSWWQRRFERYTQHFGKAFIEKFVGVFEARFGPEAERRDYFWLCFSDIAKHCPVGYNRAIHFLNLYGFSRNIACCFLIYIPLRCLVALALGSPINLYSGLILFGYFCCGLVMIKNYLKLFFRQCIELYYHFYSLHTDKTTNHSNGTT
jgi:hypothetical protein